MVPLSKKIGMSLILKQEFVRNVLEVKHLR